MRVINTPADMKNHIGEDFGASDWVLIDQATIDKFAEATGDHQWIHVDVERAKTEMPGGKTIAHGFLTLSLVPRLSATIWKIEHRSRGLNYGLNKVRFTAPVLVGSRLRAKMSLKSCDPIDNNGMQLVWSVTVEREGSDKPVCVAETVTRLYA